MNNINNYLSIFLLFIIIGCSPKIYNIPFIDTQETISLKVSLSKNEIIDLLGNPLYVNYGNQEENIISWVYEVRSKLVKSQHLSSGEILPNKIHNHKIYSKPIHRLEIFFIDNKVSHWDIIEILNDNTKISPKKKNDKYAKFYFHPTIGSDIVSVIEESSYNESFVNQTSALTLGVNLGTEFKNTLIGIDLKLTNQFGIMAVIEKRNCIKNFNCRIGGGIYQYDTPNDYQNGNFKDGSASFAKIGISHQLLNKLNLYLDIRMNTFKQIEPSITFHYKWI